MRNDTARRTSPAGENYKPSKTDNWFARLFGASSQEVHADNFASGEDQTSPTSPTSQTGSNTTRQEENGEVPAIGLTMKRSIEVGKQQAEQSSEPMTITVHSNETATQTGDGQIADGDVETTDQKVDRLSSTLNISREQALGLLAPQEQNFYEDFLENAHDVLGLDETQKPIIIVRHLLNVLNDKNEEAKVRTLQKFFNFSPGLIRAGLPEIKSRLEAVEAAHRGRDRDKDLSRFIFTSGLEQKLRAARPNVETERTRENGFFDKSLLPNEFQQIKAIVQNPKLSQKEKERRVSGITGNSSWSRHISLDQYYQRLEEDYAEQQAPRIRQPSEQLAQGEYELHSQQIRWQLDKKYGYDTTKLEPYEFVFEFEGQRTVLNQFQIKKILNPNVEAIMRRPGGLSLDQVHLKRLLGFDKNEIDIDPEKLLASVKTAYQNFERQSEILNIRGLEPFGHILKNEDLSKLTNIPLDKIQKMQSGELAVTEVEDTTNGVVNGSGSFVADILQTVARKHKEMNTGTQKIEIQAAQREIQKEWNFLLNHVHGSAFSAEDKARMLERFWKQIERKAEKEIALAAYQRKSVEEHFLYETGISINKYLEKNWATNDLLNGGELGKEAGKALVEFIVVSGANALTGGAGAALMTYMVTYSDKSQALYELARKEGYDEERAQRISNYAALTALPAAIPLSKIKNFKPVANLLNKISANNAIRTKLMSFASDILVSAGEGATQEYFAELLNQFPENAIYPNPGDEDQFRWWSDKMKAAFVKGVKSGALKGLAGTASPSSIN